MSEQRIKVWLVHAAGRPFVLMQWRDPATGKLKTESTKTDKPKDAERKRADKEYELNNGLNRQPGKMPWATFRERYEEEKLARSADATQAKAGYVLDNFTIVVEPRTIGSVTERSLSAYTSKLHADGRSPATIRGHLAYLRAALRWAKDQRLIQEVPKIDMPKAPKGASRVRIRNAAKITTEEYERLLMKAPNDGWRLLIAMAWECGLRRCEARSVCGIHVDLDQHRIAIPKNKANDQGATVFITPQLDALFRDRWPNSDLPDGLLIDPAEVTTDPHEISKQFRKIVATAAVRGGAKDGRCTLHDLRRSFGSRWAAKVPAQVLQRLMRHADIKTTMDFYAEVEQAALNILWPAAVEKPEPAARKNQAPNEAPSAVRIG